MLANNFTASASVDPINSVSTLSANAPALTFSNFAYGFATTTGKHTVSKNTKLSGHLRNYLILKYPKTIIMYETTLNEYLSAFKDRYRGATGINQEEEFFLTCCYEHLISRTTKKDFESDKAFIEYRDNAKAEAKANRVPINTGRILLTVYNKKRHYYAHKKEFSNYDSAIKYIKSLLNLGDFYCII